MNLSSLLLVAVFLAVIPLAIVLTGKWEKKHPSVPKTGENYDERQKLARAQAGLHAFTAMGVFFAADWAAIRFWGIWTEPGVDLYLGVFFGTAVFVVEAIRHDAYFGLRDNAKSFLLFGLLIVAMDAFSLIRFALRGGFAELVQNGVLTDEVSPFAAGVWWLIVVAAATLHLLAEKRAEREEDEA